MMRGAFVCQCILKHVTSIEATHLKQLRKCFLPLSNQRRWCYKTSETIQSFQVVHPVSGTRNDLLSEKFKELDSFQEMINNIDLTQRDVAGQQVDAAFRRLNNIVKEQPSLADVIQSKSWFPVLCQYTMKNIRHLNKDEVVNLILTLCSLNISLDCTLGQASLQMLRHFINDLSLHQITLLDKSIQHQGSNVLVDAIKKALPMILDIQLTYQLDRSDLWLVLNCLDMATRHNLEISTIEKLSVIVHHNAEVLSTAKAVKAALCYSNMRSFPKQMIPHAMEVLRRLHFLGMELSLKETNDLLFALSNAKHLYHSKLFTVLSHKCCHESWDLQNASLLLSIFNSHKFLSSALLNFTMDIIKNDPTPLWEDENVPLLTICESFSEANHNIDVKFFTSIIRNCNKKLDKLEKDAPELLVNLIMHLAILESLPLELLEHVLQPEFISKAMKSASEKNIEHSLLQCYLSLEQYARLECRANYQGPFLPSDLLKEAIKIRAQVMKPIDLVLQQFLEVGLGGSQFMLTGLWTKLGHFIDHLVVMQKEDFPVQFPSDKSLQPVEDSEGFKFVEDIAFPENAKMLAVLVARQEWFNKDPPRLRGWMSFQQRTLAKMGYNPVIIGPPIENADQIQDIAFTFQTRLY